MTIGTFILKNALRNKRRFALSVLSMAVSLFLLVTLLVLMRELTNPPEDLGAALRVVVRSKISLASPLPARQRPVIEKIPGVEAVTPFTWFGGQFKDEEGTPFAQFAIDPKLMRIIFGEAKMPEEQYQDFINRQNSCIVGKLTADKYHLKLGQTIVLASRYYPNDLELVIAGIYAGTPDDRNVLFHQKYLDEATGDLGQVGTWWVKVRSPEEMAQVISTLNQTFANTSAEVRAETERAFQLSFMSMFGNVKFLVSTLCTVVVFALLLVTASTMSMAVRERFRELAILKALGFRRRELFAFILAESFGLALLGGLLGIGGAYALFTYTDLIKTLTMNFFITFEVTGRMVGMASLVAALLGIVASITPALAMARTSVVKGLKTLD